jgi:hypothetical protein
MPWQNITAAYHSLIVAVIERAIDDLKGTGPRCGRKETDRAMAFILSDTCEAYCLELEIDIKAVREKAAALYRKVIVKKGTPRKARYANTPGRLSGSRPFPIHKKEIHKPYSSPQGSPRRTINSIIVIVDPVTPA